MDEFIKRKIVVIGGGPAGLLSATLLAKNGHDVFLFDKAIWPIDKVCGEGIMPAGLEVLKRHGLLEKIKPEFSRDFLGVKYINDCKMEAYGLFQNIPGKVVRRLELSRVLYEEALKQEGLSLRSSCELTDIEESKDELIIKIKNNITHTIEIFSNIDYLIGADGLRSKVKELCSREGKAPGKQPNRMGARVHIEMEPWDNKVQVYWGNNIECYVAPTSNDCVEFNFGWDHDKIKPQQNLGLENGLFSFFPDLENKVKLKNRLSKMQSLGPLPKRANIPLKGRVALIGDSSLFYDQITGEGISLALIQAELAASTLNSWHTTKGQKVFNDKIKKIAKHYILVTDAAMFLTRHPKIRKLVIWFLKRSPAYFSHVLHVNMEDYPIFPPPFKLLFKAIFNIK